MSHKCWRHSTRLSPRLHQGNMLPGNMLPGNKLLVRDTCWLYLGDIITIHLCHGRLVSQQQTGNKLATILLPIYKKHVDGNKWIQLVARQHVSWCKRGSRLNVVIFDTCGTWCDVVLQWSGRRSSDQRVPGSTPAVFTFTSRPWASCSHTCASVITQLIRCSPNDDDALRLGR